MIVDKLAIRRAKTISKYLKGMVLDVGCNTMLLKRFVSGRYVSLDLEGHPEVLASAEHLPFKNGIFDTVVGMEVVEHVKNPYQMIQECARVSKERVIFTTPNPFRLDYLLEWVLRKKDISSGFHLCRFGENEMKKLINRSLKLCECRHIFIEIPTFSRLGSIIIDADNRYGSCSMYICERKPILSQ